jgi:DNA-binding MarR family transcriptional regulator
MYNNRPSASGAVKALWREPCLAAKVRRLHRAVVGAYDEALRPHGLTVAQLDLLMTVLAAGPRVRPVDLARDLQMDRSTLSRNLDRLEDRGLVARTSGSNARESRVAVTRAGRQAAENAAAAWFATQQATRARLGPAGLKALDLLTRRLTAQED